MMPHRRLSSVEICEVVPSQDEVQCLERGYGERPHLCAAHHEEYARLTAEYKATSEKAKSLLEIVCAGDWDSALASWNLADVEEATVTTTLCIDTIKREIHERQEHHRRFFLEPHDRHEARISRLRQKLAEVEGVAAQLNRCRDALDSRQKRPAKEKHLAEQCHKQGVTTHRSQSHTRPMDSGSHDIDISADSYLHNSCSGLETDHISPTPARPICVAYPTGDPSSSGTRCTREALYDADRCQEHQDEYDQVLSELRTAKEKQRAMAVTVYYIQARNDRGSYHTLQRVTQDIDDVAQFLSLGASVNTLGATLRLLEGYSRSGERDCTTAEKNPCGLSRDIALSLHSQLECIRTELQDAGSMGTALSVAAVGVAAFLGFGWL